MECVSLTVFIHPNEQDGIVQPSVFSDIADRAVEGIRLSILFCIILVVMSFITCIHTRQQTLDVQEGQ